MKTFHNMTMNKIWQEIEGDTEKDTNWQLVNYEFPFPEDPIIKARELEADRFKEYNNRLCPCVKQSLINNNNKKESNMTTQGTFLPREEFIASKTPEERIAYVIANPGKYANKPQYDHNKNMDSKMDELLAKFTDSKTQVDLLIAKK
jgi:hypothetical protein